jgi:Tfp pilus assembly protein PilO
MKISLTQILEDKKQFSLVIILAVIIIYADFSFVLRPLLKKNSTAGKSILQLKKDLKGLKTDISRMQRFSGKGFAILAGVKQAVPEDEITSLLEKISHLAASENVKIRQILPSKPKQKKRSQLYPFLIKLDFSSGYHQLGRFIAALESSRSFLAVDSLEIDSDEDNIFLHRVELVLKTYVKK